MPVRGVSAAPLTSESTHTEEAVLVPGVKMAPSSCLYLNSLCY